AGAEIDARQITGEDLLLGEPPLERQRQKYLAELARKAALGSEIVELHELLGDGAAALAHRTGRKVGARRAQEAAQIDAVVAVEAAILDRHHRVGQRAR